MAYLNPTLIEREFQKIKMKVNFGQITKEEGERLKYEITQQQAQQRLDDAAARGSTEVSFHGLKLTSLPPLPDTITHLSLQWNQLTELPELPRSLRVLQLGQNQLTQLPELPPQLTLLDCPNNRLTSLPELPNTLRNLNCSANQLEVLPRLPESLSSLVCDANNLIELPQLPNSLNTLRCVGCNLNKLPDLPRNLYALRCHKNNLKELPELPLELRDLQCHDNKLKTLPMLPPHLSNFMDDVSLLPNPFVEPFRTFAENYHKNKNITQLINNVNNYICKIQLKEVGRSLQCIKHMGRITNVSTGPNWYYGKGPNALTRLPEATAADIGTFISGVPGNINTQRATIKAMHNASSRKGGKRLANKKRQSLRRKKHGTRRNK